MARIIALGELPVGHKRWARASLSANRAGLPGKRRLVPRPVKAGMTLLISLRSIAVPEPTKKSKPEEAKSAGFLLSRATKMPIRMLTGKRGMH